MGSKLKPSDSIGGNNYTFKKDLWVSSINFSKSPSNYQYLTIARVQPLGSPPYTSNIPIMLIIIMFPDLLRILVYELQEGRDLVSQVSQSFHRL